MGNDVTTFVDPAEFAALRAELLSAFGLWGLTQDERLEVVDQVCLEVCRIYGNVPLEELSRIGAARVRMRAIDVIRRKTIERKALKEFAAQPRGNPRACEESRAIAREAQKQLFDSIVSQLTEDERAAIYLRFYQSRTLQQTADFIGIAVSSAHCLIQKALSKLQKALREYEDLSPDVLYLAQPVPPSEQARIAPWSTIRETRAIQP